MYRWILLALLAATAAADEGRPAIRPGSELVAAAKLEITEISVPELARKPVENQVLLDVREPYEYSEGHIAGAVNIPRGRLEFDILDHPVLAWLNDSDPEQLPDTEIVVYCRTGGRAALAAQSLQSMGFRKVVSLEGGFRSWTEAGQPIEQK